MAALFSWGSDAFSDLVDKATSELLPAGQEDIALNLEICDKVRSKEVQPKHAATVIRKRITHKNPNVVLLALGLTDICIKNGGDHFLQEVVSKDFLSDLTACLREPSSLNADVKNKTLRLIQNWSQIADARPDSSLGEITDTYRTLQRRGFEFPPRDPSSIVSAALVETMTAPEWQESDVCTRCRTAFTTFNRKHHCRNCGNTFCGQCSSNTMSLPWFGVGQDVRVCDGCHGKRAPPKLAPRDKLARSKSSVAAPVVPSGRGGSASHHRSATLGSKPAARAGSSRQREEDDLALAIRLSLEASGSGSGPSSSTVRGAPSSSTGYVPSQPPTSRATRQPDGRMLEGTDADDDPDLAAAIAASLRDYAPPAPSAPLGLPGPDEARSAAPGLDAGAITPRQQSVSQESQLPLPPSLELPASDIDALLSFSQSVAQNEAQARQTGVYPAAHAGPEQQQTQALYERATQARPRMARSLDEGARRHGVLLSMHDKLTEAVRLYDRLLDAQLSRPPAQYGQSQHAGYAAAPPQQQQQQYQHPGYAQPQHTGQSQAYASAAAPPRREEPSQYPYQQQHHAPPTQQQAWSAAPPQPAESSMYPSLPPSQQQHAQPSAPSPYQERAPPSRTASYSQPQPAASPYVANAPPSQQQQYQQYAPPSPAASFAPQQLQPASAPESYASPPAQQAVASPYGQPPQGYGQQQAYAPPQPQQQQAPQQAYEAPQQSQQGYASSPQVQQQAPAQQAYQQQPQQSMYAPPSSFQQQQMPPQQRASAEQANSTTPTPTSEAQHWQQSLQTLATAPSAPSAPAAAPSSAEAWAQPQTNGTTTASAPPEQDAEALQRFAGLMSPPSSLPPQQQQPYTPNSTTSTASPTQALHSNYNSVAASPIRPPSVGSVVSNGTLSGWRDIPIAPTTPPSGAKSPLAAQQQAQQNWQRPLEPSLIEF